MNAGEPKLWRDATDAEKGALLLAHYRGQAIEWACTKIGGGWDDWDDCDDDCLWDETHFGEGFAYRIKPAEPVRETVTIRGHYDAESGLFYSSPAYVEKDYPCTITVDTLDGVPQWDTIKATGGDA